MDRSNKDKRIRLVFLRLYFFPRLFKKKYSMILINTVEFQYFFPPRSLLDKVKAPLDEQPPQARYS